MSIKDDQLIIRCSECKQSYKKNSNKGLTKRFANVYNFFDRDINKFILLLRKGVYPYEYMDSWERFDERLLPDKEAFYSGLNIEDIIDVDHKHAKRVFKKIDNKNIGDYDDLYVQSDTLLLTDAFESFRNMCLKIYGLDPVHFLSASGLAWEACLKKTGIRLELLNNIDMLVMVAKGIRGGICYAISNNKYMKYLLIFIFIFSYTQYLDANNLYGWEMPQNTCRWF